MKLKPSGEPVPMPAAFFRNMSAQEFSRLCDRNGFLTRVQIKRLWRLTDRQETPPEALQVVLKREDVMRCFPAKPVTP